MGCHGIKLRPRALSLQLCPRICQYSRVVERQFRYGVERVPRDLGGVVAGGRLASGGLAEVGERDRLGGAAVRVVVEADETDDAYLEAGLFEDFACAGIGGGLVEVDVAAGERQP